MGDGRIRSRSSLSEEELEKIYERLSIIEPALVQSLITEKFETRSDYARVAMYAQFRIWTEIFGSKGSITDLANRVFADIEERFVQPLRDDPWS